MVEIEDNWMTPIIKYLSEDEGTYVLTELHQGICGAYKAVDPLARKAAMQ